MIIGVHGFGFDPASTENNPTQLFKDWSDMLGETINPCPWYSSPLGLAGEMRAIENGFADQYAYAFKQLAVATGVSLSKVLIAGNVEVDIIAHSLGTRVVNIALGEMKRLNIASPVRRVLFLDGAELAINCTGAYPSDTTVLNIVVREDLVLKDLGSVFNDEKIGGCIGYDGLFNNTQWHDIILDDPGTGKKALDTFGWTLSASPRHRRVSGNVLQDLRNLGDHWSSYSTPGNEYLYRAWFRGGDLSSLYSDKVTRI